MSGQWLHVGVFYILALSVVGILCCLCRLNSQNTAFSTFNSVWTAKWKRDSSWKCGPWCPAHRPQLSYLPKSGSLNRQVHPATWPGHHSRQMGGPDTKSSKRGGRLPCRWPKHSTGFFCLWTSPSSCSSTKVNWVGTFPPLFSAFLCYISSSMLHET